MIIITGVTGWLGKTAINHLIEKYKTIDFENNVMVFASKNGILNIKNRKIKVYDFNFLNEIKYKIKITHIFHTAFLTKEKIEEIGLHNYKKINMGIINTIEGLLDLNPKARIVLSSSGAALPFFEDKSNSEDDLYGYLKYIEELKLSKKNDALTLRIFALTGYFIRSPRVFALSEFIFSALNTKIIKIKAEGLVFRSYASAEEIVELSWKWLLSDNKGYAINAASDNLDLLKIANIIKAILGDIYISHQIKENKIESCYIDRTNQFNERLANAGIIRKSIEENINISIMGAKEHFFNN